MRRAASDPSSFGANVARRLLSSDSVVIATACLGMVAHAILRAPPNGASQSLSLRALLCEAQRFATQSRVAAKRITAGCVGAAAQARPSARPVGKRAGRRVDYGSCSTAGSIGPRPSNAKRRTTTREGNGGLSPSLLAPGGSSRPVLDVQPCLDLWLSGHGRSPSAVVRGVLRLRAGDRGQGRGGGSSGEGGLRPPQGSLRELRESPDLHDSASRKRDLAL